MNKKELKLNEPMSQKEAAAFLRNLATGLEQGSLELGNEKFDWSEIKKVKFTFKHLDDQILIKTRLKKEPATYVEMEFARDEYDDFPAKNPEISYKKLKKRMKKSFALIQDDVQAYRFPLQKDFDFFAGDCLVMTQFPDYGDEYYPEFLEKLKMLTSSYASRDMSGFSAAFSEITRLMKECHDRYK